MSAEVIIVGAGYGGLTTAAILAHNGIEVEVMESAARLGGRATYDRKDGFLVDYGIHANRFGAEGAAAASLREVGHEIEFISMGQPLLWRDGSFVPLPAGVPQFLKAGFLSPSEKAIMVGDMLRLVSRKPAKNADVPLARAVWGTNRREVGSLFRTLAGIGLISPDIDVTSAGDFTIFLKRALRAKENVAFPRGGTSQIIDILAERIEGAGRISTGSRVKSIQIEGGSVKSVRVKEEKQRCRALVFSAPLQKLPELAPEGIPESFGERCAAIVPTAGISIDLCLTDKVSDIDGLVVTPDPVTMGHFTSNIDPETAPQGKQLATFYYPLPVETMDRREEVEREEQRFSDLLKSMFPGIMDVVEWRRVLTLKMVDGFEPRVGQTARDRPGVKAPGVENLFLAGDVVSAPGSGGDVAFASAVECARQVMSFLK